MANILPDEIKNIDEENLPEKIQTIYEYIKYMREMIEFWSTNINRGTGLAAEGLLKKATKDVTDLEGNIKRLIIDLDATEEEVHSILTEIWNDGDQRYESRITQNARSIESNVSSLNTLDGRVTTAESNITQNANQIATKVSQTTYNQLANRVTTAESNITQNANQIATKVSTSTYNQLVGRVETAESSITQNANQIALRVKTADYTGANIASKINNAATSVVISQGHIDLTGLVTATSLSSSGTTVIDGGRIQGGTLKLGGGSNKYGLLSLYNSSDKKELELNYNGLQMYRDGTYICKIGNNLYSGSTRAAIDLTSNASGFEISDQANTRPIYIFEKAITGGLKFWASSGFVRLQINAGYGYWFYDSSQTLRVKLHVTQGLGLYDSNGVQRTYASTSEFAMVDANNVNRFRVTNAGAISGASLSINGTKNRVVETEDYGKRLLYCYETPSPMFGDVGEGEIGEDGTCYVWLDPIFAETIATQQYQVFLQKYGPGECYVAERQQTHFVVKGDAGLAFGWEIKSKQIDYDQRRLDTPIEEVLKEINLGDDAIDHINEIREERLSA